MSTPRRRIKARPDEQIGGGYFVFRRGKRTGRVGIKTNVPYEHASYEAAAREAARLAALNKGEIFEVFSTTGTTFCEPVAGDVPCAHGADMQDQPVQEAA